MVQNNPNPFGIKNMRDRATRTSEKLVVLDIKVELVVGDVRKIRICSLVQVFSRFLRLHYDNLQVLKLKNIGVRMTSWLAKSLLCQLLIR